MDVLHRQGVNGSHQDVQRRSRMMGNAPSASRSPAGSNSTSAINAWKASRPSWSNSDVVMSCAKLLESQHASPERVIYHMAGWVLQVSVEEIAPEQGFEP